LLSRIKFMRNTPLWRPQPSLTPDSGDLSSETAGNRTSALAAVGLGLALAAGVGAVGFFAFVEDDQAAPVVATTAAPEPKPVTSEAATPAAKAETDAPSVLPAVAKPAPLPPADKSLAAAPAPRLELRGANSAQPATETIDVAIAESEFDIARLEEMTGMVEPVQPKPAAPTPEEAARVTATIGGDTGAGVDALAIQDEPGAPPADAEPAPSAPATAEAKPDDDDGTETASILPGAPVETEAKPAAAVAPPLQADCGWCVATYKGQRGYIYKSFLQGRGGGSAAITKKSKPGLF
jgi:hypothetical protein